MVGLGHADFSGEVERVLDMVEGVLLVVDATEGPMTQTRFVLSKALKKGLKPIVIMNKADRQTTNIDQTDSDIMDLFCSLEANDNQMDYPILYASGKEGWAVLNPSEIHPNDKNNGSSSSNIIIRDMKPLFETILDRIPSPKLDRSLPFSMLVTQIENDSYVGKCLLGKIQSGSVKLGQQVKAIDRTGKQIDEGRITKILSIKSGHLKVPIEEAGAGDIIQLAGLSRAGVSTTICDGKVNEPLPVRKENLFTNN